MSSFSLKHGVVLSALSLQQAFAYSFALEANEKVGVTELSPLVKLSQARVNCGNVPCLTFNERISMSRQLESMLMLVLCLDKSEVHVLA